MKNAVLKKLYQSEAIGAKSNFLDFESTNGENIRCKKDLIYCVKSQWVHDERMTRPINGYTHSHKIFVVGIDCEGNPVMVTTMSINNFRLTHYGDFAVPKEIPAIKNEEGLWRPRWDVDTYRVFDGDFPLRRYGNSAYIEHDFAFKIINKKRVSVANQIIKKGHSFDMNTYEKNGQTYIKLGDSVITESVEITQVPQIDWANIIEKEFQYLFDNIPN